MPRAKKRRSFGSVRTLPSGRIQARYGCPTCQGMHSASVTFDTIGDADTYLSGVRTDIAREKYVCPVERKAAEDAARKAGQPFSEYAVGWLQRRKVRPRTRMLYQSILDRELLPVFGDVAITDLTASMVRGWWQSLPVDRPTANSHAYSLLRTIMGTAVDEERLTVNPCRIKGAGVTKRARQIKPATPEQLRTIVENMPEQWRLLVLLNAACALRIGESTELRRLDVDLSHPELAVLHVHRAVTYREGQTIVGPPKSEAGVRAVTAPPWLRPLVVGHLERWAQPGEHGLLFTGVRPELGTCDCGHPGCVGGHLAATVLYKHWDPARRVAGRPDLRLHDLRHTGAVEAARHGATLAELMGRLGHTTPAMALRYQHVAEGRDAEIARRIGAGWSV